MKNDLPECLEKLKGMETDKAIQLVYEWTKTGHINFPVFKALVTYVVLSAIDNS